MQLPDSPTLPSNHPLANHESSIDQLRECGQFFHQRGWSVGTSSNYSVVLGTDPVELIVTASGKDKGRLQRDDFVHVGADGEPIESDQPKSSAETMLHVVLAEQEGIGCILHTHSVWGTLLSDHFFATMPASKFPVSKCSRACKESPATKNPIGCRSSKILRTSRRWPKRSSPG